MTNDITLVPTFLTRNFAKFNLNLEEFGALLEMSSFAGELSFMDYLAYKDSKEVIDDLKSAAEVMGIIKKVEKQELCKIDISGEFIAIDWLPRALGLNTETGEQ